MSRPQAFAVLTLLALSLAACGQRGALYLPGTPDPAEQPATTEDAEELDEEESR